MELSFSDLRTKEVINTLDGRRLGKVCDVVLCYPENRWLGIVVPGGRGFGKKKSELFIELRSITKVGEDVILVNVGFPRRPSGKRVQTAPIQGGIPPQNNYPYGGTPQPQGRNYEEFE
jgi:YlmC/YmxH family sporulation protein